MPLLLKLEIDFNISRTPSLRFSTRKKLAAGISQYFSGPIWSNKLGQSRVNVTMHDIFRPMLKSSWKFLNYFLEKWRKVHQLVRAELILLCFQSLLYLIRSCCLFCSQCIYFLFYMNNLDNSGSQKILWIENIFVSKLFLGQKCF